MLDLCPYCAVCNIKLRNSYAFHLRFCKGDRSARRAMTDQRLDIRPKPAAGTCIQQKNLKRRTNKPERVCERRGFNYSSETPKEKHGRG